MVVVMSFDPLSAALSLGEAAINRIWPDETKRAEEMRKLKELEQKGDLAQLNAHVSLMLKQAEINLADANSSSKFQSWWRPAVGWVGVISLFCMYVPKAIVMTYIWSYQAFTVLERWDGTGNLMLPSFPNLGATDMIALIGSLLGVAVMRSHDKVKGVQSKK
jgi:hypothetical protein